MPKNFPEIETYFRSQKLPLYLAPYIGDNYTSHRILVLTESCRILPCISTFEDATKFYAGECPMTEKERDSIDMASRIERKQGAVYETILKMLQDNGLTYDDVMVHRFLLRPITTQNNPFELPQLDYQRSAEAFREIVIRAQPQKIVFCGDHLDDLVESTYTRQYNQSFKDFASKNGIEVKGVSNQSDWNLTNFIANTSNVHGKAKYKLLSQAFDVAIDNDDKARIIALIREFQKEVLFKSPGNEPEDNTSESSEEKRAIRKQITDKAREQRNENRQKARSENEYWNKYNERALNLCKGHPEHYLLPYIGNNYLNAPIRILSLGESHYKKAKTDGSRPDLANDTTIDVFLGSYQWNSWDFRNDTFSESIKYIAVPNYCRCYRKVASMITGMDQADSDFVYDNIAFANFFQCAVSDAWRDIKKGDWVTQVDVDEANHNLFNVTLPKLKPHLVIVWGKRLRDCMKKEGIIGSPIKDHDEFFKYEGFPDTLFLQIPHPSSFGKGGWGKHVLNSWELVKKMYPKIATLAKPHPASEEVKKIYGQLKNTFGGLFQYFFSDCSTVVRLFPIENGVANGKSPKVMYLEASFDKQMNAKIRFYTKDYKTDSAKEILSHACWNLPQNICDNSENGKILLASLKTGTPLDTTVLKFIDIAQRMITYRDAVKW